MSDSSNSPVASALRKLARQPSFIVVCIVLLVAAVSLNASVEFLQLHFQKLPVDLRAELTKVPGRLGPWVQVSNDEPLPVDQLHTLGTEQYIFRFYADSRLIKAERIAEFNGKDFNERSRLLQKLLAENAPAVMCLGITYYTGMVDTVAHIPDRCYVADGYAPVNPRSITWKAFEGREGRNSKYDARMITFEDQSVNRTSVPKCVSYFFHCNGQYESDPIGVRKRLGNLFERFGYYSKVELMMQLHDGDASGERMDDFLHYALPEIEKCLPDWKSVTAKKT